MEPLLELKLTGSLESYLTDFKLLDELRLDRLSDSVLILF